MNIAQSIKQVILTVAPPPQLKVSEWADKYRILSPESSAEPGQWMTERVQYTREIMDTVNDQTIEDIVVISSAQIGKTECLNNIIGYYIDQDPSPLMVVQPTIEMGQTWSKDRFSPMIRDTKCLTSKIKPPRTKDSENTILQKHFPGGNLTVSGANSPASLAGRPKRIVICDDVDRFPFSAGSEGDPVNLAFKRTTAFWNRKRYLFSTPTNQMSRIQKEFDLSDQRHYFVPCPKCGEFQTLEWQNEEKTKYYVKWEKDANDNYINKSAYYECKHCGAHLIDADILWMVRNGEWRATKPFNGRAGFHINELYSPFVTLDETVRNFLEVKDDPERLKTWVNTALAEVFIERGDAPPWKDIFIRRENYEKGIIPKGGLLLVAGADVHQGLIETEIVAYGRNKESWSIDYRIIFGDIASGKPLEKLDELLNESFLHENGNVLNIRMIAVDSGYETQTIYNWVRKYPYNRVMAVKGSDVLNTALTGPRSTDIFIDGKKLTKGMKYWPVGVSIIKSELYGLLRLEKRKDGSYPKGYCHFPDYEEEYFKQLTAESLKIIRTRANRKIFRWELDYTNNEALDCRVYARAAAAALGMDLFSEETWRKLEAGTFSIDKKPAIAQKQQENKLTKKGKKRILSKGIHI
ncbi:MAG: phage terminase large subunit family protein [Candidatus Hodarchaeota archaeon]